MHQPDLKYVQYRMLWNFELFGILVAKDQAQKETQLFEKAKGATMSAFRV